MRCGDLAGAGAAVALFPDRSTRLCVVSGCQTVRRGVVVARASSAMTICRTITSEGATA